MALPQKKDDVKRMPRYRAWDKTKNEMIDLLGWRLYKLDQYQLFTIDGYRILDIDDVIFEQWTGESKWEEGKRVLDYYEGDVVECTLLNVNSGCDVVIGTGVITYNCAGFDVVMEDGTLGKRGRCNLQNIRKIGTIHDNQ